MPTPAAPAFFARSGIISGTGFAIAITMALSAIEATISSLTHPGAETPIKISAPLRASASVPRLCSLFENSAISCFAGVMPSLPRQIMPLRSHIITSFIPIDIHSFAMAKPAAPAPLKTATQSFISFLTYLRAFISAAEQTTAVPCWSS